MFIDNKKIVFQKKKINNKIFFSIKSFFYKIINKIDFFSKIFFITIIVIIVYGLYLNNKIINRINGKVWELPAFVYGSILKFKPGMFYTKCDLISILNFHHYLKVDVLNNSGEYIVKEDNIELIRRSFNFPDCNEGILHVCLYFNKNKISNIINIKNNKSIFFFRLDPVLVNMIHTSNKEERLFLPLSNFSNKMINILLSIEDKNFFYHSGINPFSMCRAFIANIHAGKIVQGASTLTQQLARNLFLSNKRSFLRKFNEIYIAIIIDALYSKNRILELYFNEVYFGQFGIYEIRGFPLASIYYFGRPINELSLDQQVLLISMVKGASIYNPWNNPKLVLRRRNLILRLIFNTNIICYKDYCFFINRPLGVLSKSKSITKKPVFMRMLCHELKIKLGKKINDISGSKIFTTLNLRSQYFAEKSVKLNILFSRDKLKMNNLKAFMIIVDRFTGEIHGVVGSASTKIINYNKILESRRSIGSLAKIIIYLSLLDNPNIYGFNTWIENKPMTIGLSNFNNFKFKNYNNKFIDRIILLDDIVNLMNVPLINSKINLDLKNILNTWFRLGLYKYKSKYSIFSSLINMTPVQVAQIFQLISNEGNKSCLFIIKSIILENGKIIYHNHYSFNHVVRSQAAWLTLYGMQKIFKGTVNSLNILYPHANIAGKNSFSTGSSWFVGIDYKDVIVSWIGIDNKKSLFLSHFNAMQMYKCYLTYLPPIPLVLFPLSDIFRVNIDHNNKIVCENNIWRKIPIWDFNHSFSHFCKDHGKECISNSLVFDKNKNKSIIYWIKRFFSLYF
ncbi:penicillin-binding protein 1B [Candidatus Purcelliella pentastirinorum]|uniref:penicillin-binding protein 1B n=1 Tax=Candidatus Purcelliella pentastirinorum TaxID=472834 RepID=UPI002367FB38|nr:penicillin-binding protein 1B [Candidatus Purcelliella pentastirinorum]WDI79060.1 penicillin-binding protein 1B [Candidatus Purcelliella pentastirinorum]WDR80198.1 penicillin-binding protein 1B [Candidatus Purcelliella pentastirinorum]